MTRSELKQLIRETIEEIAMSGGNLDQQIDDLATEYKEICSTKSDRCVYGQQPPEELLVKMVQIARSQRASLQDVNKLLAKKLGIGLWKRNPNNKFA